MSQPQPRSPAPPQPAQPAPAVADRRVGLVEFLLLVVGAEVCRHVQFPVRAIGIAFAIAAVIVGIRLLVGRRGQPRGRTDSVVLWVGLFLAGSLLLWHLAALLFSPFIGDYEQCLREAVTRTGREQCQDDFVQRLQRLQPELKTRST